MQQFSYFGSRLTLTMCLNILDINCLEKIVNGYVLKDIAYIILFIRKINWWKKLDIYDL